MKINSAKELEVYRKAYQLAMEVFEASKRFPAEERYALSSQIRRSSRSICLNLREAWAKRRYEAHFVSKLTDCDGENAETDSSLNFARDCGYVTADRHAAMTALCVEIGRMLGSMLKNPAPFLISGARTTVVGAQSEGSALRPLTSVLRPPTSAPSPMPPVIEVSGLSKRYVIEHEARHDNLRDTLHHTARKLWRRVRWGTGFEQEEFWALRDVSFSVQPGEVVGVIGRNGAGKSTLLKILSRITEPTSGRVALRGRVASLLEVGTGFHPDLTGRENVYLNGAILGMKRAEIRAKFDEIVAFAEIERFLDTPVKRYSSGMYVRLAFAVAAHLEPEILIIDEVLAVGDATFQKKCLGKMNEVAAEHGRTILFVSHNSSAIRSLCSHALLLEAGRSTHFGAASAVLEIYLKSQAPRTGEVYWTDFTQAPGNDQVRLHRVRLVLPDTEQSVPDIHTPVDFEVSYWNRLAGCQQNVSIVLHTLSGVCVLNTYSLSQPMPAGLITATCHVPGDLLNDETYQLEVLIVKDTSSILYQHREAITFTVADGQRPGNWHGKHSGVIRPKFRWKIGPAKTGTP